MFSGPSVRIAGGLLYGGTAGLLLGALAYRLRWAGDASLTEPQHLWMLLMHLMVGLAYGSVFGLVFWAKSRPLLAWVATALFGPCAVLFAHPLASLLSGPGPQADSVAIAVMGAGPVAGWAAGSLAARATTRLE